MTTQDAQYLYDNLLDKSFTYSIEIIDHIKENLKYKTNIRINIYNKEVMIFSYDSCIEGRKNVITYAIKDGQRSKVYNWIIEYVKSNTAYKNILDYTEVIKNKKIEVKKDLMIKIKTIYLGWIHSDDYKFTFNIRFPKYRELVENTSTIETMFDGFEISIIGKNNVEIIKPNTGSIIRNEIEKIERDYYLKKEYLELLEQLSKYIKKEVKYFFLNISNRQDLEVTARF
jgi:hypothetical protein